MEVKLRRGTKAIGAGRSLDADPLCRARASRRTPIPPDGRFAAAISPPCARAISRQRLKPSPLPSPGDPAPRKNLSKICGSSAGWIPSPVSATRIIARFASLFRLTSIDPPAGVNFSALSSRFTIRRRRCPSLPLTKTSSGALTESFILCDCASGPTVADYLAQQRAKIQLLPIDHHFAVEPREHQQFVGNPAQRQRLAMRRAKGSAIFRGASGRARAQPRAPCAAPPAASAVHAPRRTRICARWPPLAPAAPTAS